MATDEGADKAATCDKDKRHGARIAQCDEIQENMNMTVHAACEEEEEGTEKGLDFMILALHRFA